MAWAERLPGGKYRGCWRNPDGTQGHTTRVTHPEHPWGRKRDALEVAQEEEVKARRRAAAATGTLSAKTPWGEWWDLIEPTHPESDTASVEKSLVKNYIRPTWGSTALNKIYQVDVKAWILGLLPGREASYVNRIYAVFRWSMNQAVDKKILTASPCVGIKIPRAPKKAKAYTDEEYLDAIHPKLPQWYRDLDDLGMETGLRPGELCGLHADMCDLKTGWVTVSKVLVADRKAIRHYPKDKDIRQVPLTDKAIAIIRRNLEGRDRKAGCGLPHTNGKPCTSVLVIVNSLGTVIAPKVWRKMINDAARRAKVEVRGRTPYAVRRGFGTRAARGNIDAFELADIMGHADVRQTQEYVQQTPAARDRLRKALGETPRLTIVDGKAGADTPAAGAEPGADQTNRPAQDGTSETEKETG